MNTETQKAHLIGICGAGMSAVAILLRDAGWQITGSDAGFYPPISDLLYAQGIECRTPHSAANIPADAETIIIGKHAKLVPESNKEVREAFLRREQGRAKIFSYPEILHEITQATTNIVVAGSYGKSTTSALIAWLLREGGQHPSFFIGAIPHDLGTNAQRGNGSYFVLEGDEYPAANWDSTPKFLYYNPKTVVFTSGEHDHFNEFPTEEAYIDTYRRLLHALPADGLLVACLDGKHVEKLLPEAPCRVVTYATQSDRADWTAQIVSQSETGTRFLISRHSHAGDGENQSEHAEFETQLLGAHNVQNLLGAIATLRELNILPLEVMDTAVASFTGLARRLQPKTSRSQITVYEDLSSSRPKAMAALSAVRARHPQARIFAVFQPHTFSFRSRQALDWYPGLFADADEVLVFSPPDLPGLDASQQLTRAEIVDSIRQGNAAPTRAVENNAETLEALQADLRPGDVVLLMTSGGMNGMIVPIVAMVETAFPALPPTEADASLPLSENEAS